MNPDNMKHGIKYQAHYNVRLNINLLSARIMYYQPFYKKDALFRLIIYEQLNLYLIISNFHHLEEIKDNIKH